MTGWRWLRAPLLLKLACSVGLLSLLSTSVGVLVPYALPVVLSMSVGQGLGALAFVGYLLAIIAEVLEHDAAKRELERRRRASLRAKP